MTTATLPPGAIHDYTLLRRIGAGSYGEVWLARGVTGAFYAIKVVHRSRFEDSKPFAREFAGIRNFEPVSRTHVSQLPILHVGGDEAEDFFYYVMELADDRRTGRNIVPESYEPHTLQDELKERGRLPAAECVRIGMALTAALEHMHRHGLVHRDIKPSNIVFLHGVPRLADPGLVACATGSSSFVGTEGYLPPEGPGSPQADIYSLGKVLYEISMGRDRKDYPELPTRLHELPDSPLLVELNEVLLKACHADPRQRYANAAEMHADLAVLQTGRSVIRLHALSRRFALMRRVAAMLLVIACLAGAGWWQMRRAARQARLDLARSRVTAAEPWVRAGDLGAALPFYREAFDLARSAGDDGKVHRFRIGALLSQCAAVEHSFSFQGPVRDLVFSPDGRWLATAGSDGLARLFSVSNGLAMKMDLPQPASVSKVKFSPDSKWLAAAGDEGVVRVWEVESGRPALSLPSLGAPASLPAGSEDGLAGKDAGAPSGVRSRSTNHLLTGLVFNPSGTRLLVLAGAEISVLPILESQTDSVVLAHSGQVHSAVFSLDGRRILSASGWRSNSTVGGEARVWDANTGTSRLVIPQASPLLIARFSQGGDRILTVGEDGAAALWNAETSQRAAILEPGGLWIDAAFGPDDKWVAAVGADQSVHFFNPATGAPLRATARHGSTVTRMALSPDGERIVTVGTDNSARLWRTADAEPALPPLHHAGWIDQVQFSPDGSHLLTAGEDGTAAQWDLRPRGLVERQVPMEKPVIHADLSASGDRVAAVVGEPGSPCEIFCFDVSGTNRFTLPASSVGQALRLQFSPDGRRLATAGLDRRAQVWDVATQQPVTPALEHPFPVWQARFDPSGNRLVTAASAEGQPGEVRVWDLATGRLAFPAIITGDEVMSATFSPDGRYLAAGSGSPGGKGAARLWDAVSGQPVSPVLPLDGPVWVIAFSRDGRRLATAGQDTSVCLWNVPAGTPGAPPLRHAGPVTLLSFSPDGRQLLTAASDQTLRLWDAATGAALLPPLKQEGPVKDAGFDASGRLLVVACADSSISVWDTRDGSLVVPPIKHGGSGALARFLPDSRDWVTFGQTTGVTFWKVPLPDNSRISGIVPVLSGMPR